MLKTEQMGGFHQSTDITSSNSNSSQVAGFFEFGVTEFFLGGEGFGTFSP